MTCEKCNTKPLGCVDAGNYAGLGGDSKCCSKEVGLDGNCKCSWIGQNAGGKQENCCIRNAVIDNQGNCKLPEETGCVDAGTHPGLAGASECCSKQLDGDGNCKCSEFRENAGGKQENCCNKNAFVDIWGNCKRPENLCTRSADCNPGYACVGGRCMKGLLHFRLGRHPAAYLHRYSLYTEPPPVRECECGRENSVIQHANWNRIIDGDETGRHQYPWMVQIITGVGRLRENFDPNQIGWGGGSIISPLHILTAAHVMYNDKVSPSVQWEANQIRVIVGIHRTRVGRDDYDPDNSDILTVKELVLHEGYSDDRNINPNFENDVAILVLDSPLIYSNNIRPICLPSDPMKTYANGFATATGWGYATGA